MRLLTLMMAAFIAIMNVTYGQLPQLTASDTTSPITLQKLSVDVRIIGNRAVTTYDMTFYNPSDKILEGTFSLSLPEKATVTRYALDIEGKMREGVPVEKAKATQVFESIEKRKVDPGLLEQTEGNIFRTRIFPFTARGSRSIIIAFESELKLDKNKALRYDLPLNAKQAIPYTAFNIQVYQKGVIPTIVKRPVDALSFTDYKGQYCAYTVKENALLNGDLSISIPKPDDALETFVQKGDDEYYFYLQSFIAPSDKDKKLPKKLAVIWDVSLSGMYRDTKKEMALLQAYLERIGNVSVSLYTLNNLFQPQGNFDVRNGNSKALIEKLQAFHYDGGTDYSRIKLPVTDEVLLFSDGLSTLSEADQFHANGLMYTITTSAKAAYSQLQRVAEESGGVFINLATMTAKDAVEKLIKQPLLFLGVKDGKGLSEYYPAAYTPVQNNFSMAGIMKEQGTTITLLFGFGKTIAFEKKIALHYDEYDVPSWNLPRMLAQKKINQLDRNYEKHAATILELGKRYSLVTRNTSLLVLEDVRDYVRYKIQPPADLWAAYKQLLQEEDEMSSFSQKSAIDNAIRLSDELWEWWQASYPANKKRKKNTEGMIITDSVATAADRSTADMHLSPPPPPRQEEIRSVRLAAPHIISEGALEGKAAGIAVQQEALDEVVVTAYSAATIRTAAGQYSGTGRQLIIVDGVPVTVMPAKESIESVEEISPDRSVPLYGFRAMNGVLIVTTKGARAIPPEIQLQEKASFASYLKELSRTPKPQQFALYLKLRDKNLLNPTFYYDVANFFFKQDKALGLQILTNLGELDYQNHELHKLFAFKLKEWGQYEHGAYILRKVLQWRPQEPQSYRDYALALIHLGKYQNALDTLYLALAKDYNSDVMDNYEGIEETIVTEMARLVNRHAGQLNTSGIDKRLLRNMPVDIRVVMNWNMNDTDIDLWITDPTGETCDYRNKQTVIGGRISQDFTEGYGPEQFLLKKAVKGKYKIQVHYYGESGAKIAGKTTLLLEVYTNYGKPDEKCQLITLQLEGEEKEGIYVGSFHYF